MTRHLFGFMCVLALGVVPLVGCSETSGDGGSGGSGGNGGVGGADLCEGVACNDYAQCTTDTCDDGVCDSTLVADGTTCDDGNECTTSRCDDRGRCRSTPVADGTSCDDGNECTANGVCADGTCDSAPIADGTSCADGNECTGDGVCADGICDATPVADGTMCGGDAGACQQGSCRVACSEQGIRDAIAVGGGPYTFDCDGPATVLSESEIVIYNDVILDGEGNLTVEEGSGEVVFSVTEFVTAELRGMTVTTFISNSSGALTMTDSSMFWITSTGTLTLSNSTFGGIGARGKVTVTNSTLSGEIAALWICDAIVTIENSTVVAGISESAKCTSTGSSHLTVASSVVIGDCGSRLGTASNGYNIESPGDTCGFDQPTDQVNVSAEDLKLGELADNGGPTMTHALLPGSVAIDVIPADDCEVETDQRGEPRDSMCDVGAFEVQEGSL